MQAGCRLPFVPPSLQDVARSNSWMLPSAACRTRAVQHARICAGQAGMSLPGQPLPGVGARRHSGGLRQTQGPQRPAGHGSCQRH